MRKLMLVSIFSYLYFASLGQDIELSVFRMTDVHQFLSFSYSREKIQRLVYTYKGLDTNSCTDMTYVLSRDGAIMYSILSSCKDIGDTTFYSNYCNNIYNCRCIWNDSLETSSDKKFKCNKEGQMISFTLNDFKGEYKYSENGKILEEIVYTGGNYYKAIYRYTSKRLKSILYLKESSRSGATFNSKKDLLFDTTYEKRFFYNRRNQFYKIELQKFNNEGKLNDLLCAKFLYNKGILYKIKSEKRGSKEYLPDVLVSFVFFPRFLSPQTLKEAPPGGIKGAK